MSRVCLPPACELSCDPPCADGRAHPIVTHGHTLCTSVTFASVAAAIAECAFETSSLPVVLSLEMHCSAPQQRQVWALALLPSAGWHTTCGGGWGTTSFTSHSFLVGISHLDCPSVSFTQHGVCPRVRPPPVRLWSLILPRSLSDRLHSSSCATSERGCSRRRNCAPRSTRAVYLPSIWRGGFSSKAK